jgi:CRP/FNR family cyclic AMP-dependent transcriptional regulator
MIGFHKGNEWIDQLPTAVQAQIRSRLFVETLEEGEHLYQRGADAIGLYQVLGGFLQLKAVGASGDEILITVYGPGSWLGEIPLLGDGERAYDAIAQGKVEIATLPRADFEELSKLYPEISQRLVAKLCQVISGLLFHIEETSLLSLRARLAKLILSAAKTYGSKQREGIVIAMPLSQADLGKMLGVTRYNIQREIKYWKTKGLIDKQKGRWIVTDINEIKTLKNHD